MQSFIHASFLSKRVFECIIQRLLGIKMASFRLRLVSRWSPEGFEVYKEGLDDDSDVESS